MQETKKKNILLEIILLVVVFIMYLSWSIILPYNSGPDEHMRYDIAKYIYNNGTLPHGGDETIRNGIWGISYGFTPILSYIIGAGFMKVVSFITTSGIALVLAARIVSVLASVGTVFLCMKIGEKLFKGIYKWIFTILVGFLPQFVFISAYVNIDSLAIFSTAIIVYSWIIGLEKNWNLKSLILLGVRHFYMCTFIL